jgi:uncharacterized protein
MQHDFNPHDLPVEAFAKAAGQLQGAWPLSSMERLLSTMHSPSALVSPEVTWSAAGQMRPAAAQPPQVWLTLQARCPANLVCQRCLGCIDLALSTQRTFLFVQGEAQAEKLDAQTDDDVLALTKSLNLHTLIEDELLLALPLVPRHDACPEPIVLPKPKLLEVGTPHPFAALAALKKH